MFGPPKKKGKDHISQTFTHKGVVREIVSRLGSGWIDTEGNHYPNEGHGIGGHEDTLKKLKADGRGWMKVAPVAGDREVLSGHVDGGVPSPLQRLALKKIARQYGYESAVATGTNTHQPLQLARSYVYVSPSVREGSTMGQAIMAFNSPEHQKLNQAARDLGAKPTSAMGTWLDGAEESSVLTLPAERAAKVAALLGKKFNQKAVAIFHPGPGDDTLHLIYLPGYNPEAADHKLKVAGIQYATHVPVRGGTLAHVIGADPAAVASLGVPSRVMTGRAEFPGAETREEAAKVFDRMTLARELPEAEWPDREDESPSTEFTVQGRPYTAQFTWMNPGHHDFEVRDESANTWAQGYSNNKSGNAAEWAMKTAAHFIHGVRNHKFPKVTFSTHEPSKIKLYDRAAAQFNKYLPEYDLERTEGSVLHPTEHGDVGTSPGVTWTLTRRIGLARELPEVVGGWQRSPHGHYFRTFESGPNKYRAQFSANWNGTHTFDFNQINQDNQPKTSNPYGITGAGNAMETMTKAAAHLIHGIKTLGINKVHFNSYEPSRTKLYHAMLGKVGKYLPDHELTSHEADELGGGLPSTHFYLTKKPVTTLARELPIEPVQWNESIIQHPTIAKTARSLKSNFMAGNNRYRVDFVKQHGQPDAYSFSFGMESSPGSGEIHYDRTGEGNGTEVFTKAVHRLVDGIKAIKPRRVKFTGDLGDPARVKLYRKWVPRIVERFLPGYEHVEEKPGTFVIREKGKVKLARFQAPSGGMIVNNQYYDGGKFLPRVLESIRSVRARRAKRPLMLMRNPEYDGWVDGDGKFHANGDRVHEETATALTGEYKDPEGTLHRQGYMKTADGEDGVLYGYHPEGIYHSKQITRLKKLAQAGGFKAVGLHTRVNGRPGTREIKLSRSTADDLWASVSKNPDDPSHRAILSDHLDESGHPEIADMVRRSRRMEGLDYAPPEHSDGSWRHFIDAIDNPATHPFLRRAHNGGGRPYVLWWVHQPDGHLKGFSAKYPTHEDTIPVMDRVREYASAAKATHLARVNLPRGAFKQKTLTDDQIRQLEDHHGLMDHERLTRTVNPDGTVSTKIEHLAPFFDRLAKTHPDTQRILNDPDTSDDVKFMHLMTHSHDSAKDYLTHVDPKAWYGSAIRKLDKGLHELFADKGWTPHHGKLFKMLLALTSYNTAPIQNTKNALNALMAGYRHSPDHPFENIPDTNYEALAPYKDLPPPGTDLRSRMAWQATHGSKTPGYMVAPVRVDVTGLPVGFVNLDNTVRWTAPGYTKENTKPGIIPLVDEQGRLRAKTWGSMPAERVQKFKAFLHKAGGSYRKAAKMLDASYTPAQLKALFGLKTVNRGDIDPGEKIPGSYAFGPKFGAFYRNLSGDKNRITMDKWYSRTMSRLVGKLMNNDKIAEVPEGPLQRRLWKQVGEAAAKKLGLTPADFQATLWFYEQNLWRLFGAKNRSEDFADGITEVLNA